MQPEPARTAPGRAMTSVIYWTVLGLVIKKPGYGREIYLRYQEEFADLQPVSSEGHVYTALDNLVKRGYVEEIASIGSGRQPKVRYRANEAGKLDYADWLVKEMDEECRRQALWVRQFGMLASNRDAAEPILLKVREKYIEHAGEYGDQSFDPDRPPSVDELVAERQRLVLGAILSWLRYAKRRFAPRRNDDEPPRT
jgi:DNA-binding PadR family transcriptional regulator